jgi:hypothetical protein
MLVISILIALLNSESSRASELVKEGLRSRSELTSVYNIHFTRKLTSEGVSRTSEVKLWRKGTKRRVDSKMKDNDNSHTQITCINCVRDNYHILTKIGGNDGRHNRFVEFRDRSKLFVDDEFVDIDWRFYGILNGCHSHYTTANAYNIMLSHLNNTSTITKFQDNSDFSGLRTISSTFTYDKFIASYFFSEAYGGLPVRMLHTNTLPSSLSEVTETSVTLQKLTQPKSFFFPKTVRHVYTRGGKKIIDETIEITFVSFNHELDESVFTLESMNLSENHFIGFPELQPQNYPQWKNGRINSSYTYANRMDEDMRAGKIALPAPSDDQLLIASAKPGGGYPQPSRWSAMMIIGIVAMVLAAVTFIYAVLKKRKSK